MALTRPWWSGGLSRRSLGEGGSFGVVACRAVALAKARVVEYWSNGWLVCERRGRLALSQRERREVRDSSVGERQRSTPIHHPISITHHSITPRTRTRTRTRTINTTNHRSPITMDALAPSAFIFTPLLHYSIASRTRTSTRTRKPITNHRSPFTPDAPAPSLNSQLSTLNCFAASAPHSQLSTPNVRGQLTILNCAVPRTRTRTINTTDHQSLITIHLDASAPTGSLAASKRISSSKFNGFTMCASNPASFDLRRSSS